jgi:hypothetical protein
MTQNVNEEKQTKMKDLEKWRGKGPINPENSDFLPLRFIGSGQTDAKTMYICARW